MPTELPAEYAELSRWFPTLSDRARAVGVTRQRASAWERAPAACRVHATTADAIRRIASVSADVERQIGDPGAAGRWLLTEQPALRGDVPAALVRAADADALALVAALVFGPQRTPRRTAAARSGEPTASMLPRSVPRERVRDADEAAILRLLGEPEELIGPISGSG